MAGLEDLFDVGDYKKVEKGSKKANKSKETRKAKAEKKSIRYPLPVRVRSGHICCNLLAEEYDGKTVSETDIKNRIQQNYPELSDIQFNLVKFSNTYTEVLEKQGKLQSLKSFISGMEESNMEGKNTGNEELEFASASQEEELAVAVESKNTEETEQEEAENVEEDEIADGENESSEKDTNKQEKGCWIKLEIHYQELAKEQTVTFPVSVVVGSTVMLLEKDTESVAEIRAKWTEMHPEYTGCLFHYDDKQNMLIPFMHGESEIRGKKYKLPVTVGYLNLVESYSATDFGTESVTEAQIRAKYAQTHPEFENALFAYTAEVNHLFPVLNFKKEESSEQYSLPMLVRGPGFQMTLQETDFKGKTAVTLQEIRVAIEMVYPEFSKERTEMVYDERGFVIPILKGSRKGLTILSERGDQNIFFVTGRNGEPYRIEQMPYGVFDCHIAGKEVDFHLSAEKIPVDILKEILAFFKSASDKEAAVQIFYDTETKKYELYYPKQRASQYSVIFERNPKLEQEKVLVMDAHSHGCMRAFFSSVDDHDEKGTRLFLVMGRVDGDNPEWKLRVGIAGFYKYLCLDEIFHVED